MSRAEGAAFFMSSLLDIDAFRDACAQFATGVAIATVLAPDGSPHGLTVSSFTSVSLQPPLILICIDYACSIISYFKNDCNFAVNILNDAQRELSVRFSIKPEGRFEGVEWYSGLSGTPLIPDSLVQFECTVEQMIGAGDHAVLIGRVLKVVSKSGRPLLYFNRTYRNVVQLADI